MSEKITEMIRAIPLRFSGKARDFIEYLDKQIGYCEETHTDIKLDSMLVKDDKDEPYIVFWGTRPFTKDELKEKQDDYLNQQASLTVDNLIENTIDKILKIKETKNA